jgi:hypothetical protein
MLESILQSNNKDRVQSIHATLFDEELNREIKEEAREWRD